MDQQILVRNIADALASWAPVHLAESYDNVGLLVGYPDQVATGAVIALDMTETVILDAVAQGANMVIAHHPIWFTARKRLTGEDYVSRAIMTAIKHDVALYACHTNLDNVRHGVNARMAAQLSLQQTRILQPKNEDETVGSGMIGTLPQPLSPADFLQTVKQAFGSGGIRYAAGHQTTIHRVAICGGAGSFLTQAARRADADALVTADITYHKFFDAEGKMFLLDIGHYESEQYTSELIREYLSKKFPIFALQLSKVPTNPVTYY